MLQLSLFVRILGEAEIKHRGVCASSMQQVLSDLHQQQLRSEEESESDELLRAVDNLRTIVQWEQGQQR